MKLTRYTMDKMEEAIDLKTDAYMKLASVIDNPIWPARHILQPCLIKRTRMMGMPSGMGSVVNPFHYLDERKNR